jgi:hypothetical protein
VSEGRALVLIVHTPRPPLEGHRVSPMLSGQGEWQNIRSRSWSIRRAGGNGPYRTGVYHSRRARKRSTDEMQPVRPSHCISQLEINMEVFTTLRSVARDAHQPDCPMARGGVTRDVAVETCSKPVALRRCIYKGLTNLQIGGRSLIIGALFGGRSALPLLQFLVSIAFNAIFIGLIPGGIGSCTNRSQRNVRLPFRTETSAVRNLFACGQKT